MPSSSDLIDGKDFDPSIELEFTMKVPPELTSCRKSIKYVLSNNTFYRQIDCG